MPTRTFRSARVVRFGEFELDVRAAELRRNGEKLRLQEQPFRILTILLERPGEAVLREEIRKRLWPNDTVVEVGHGINAAILRLREALGESAENPRYIETLARRGYRFKGEVTVVSRDAAFAPAASNSTESERDDLRSRTILHYRVLEKLGGGGMGVVYRAEDLKLGREVALKMLPRELATDSSAVERFRREARAASALNHPNVCTIYAVEEFGPQPVIVMEMIEGETLASRLARGPLPLAEAMPLAIQVAGALEAAHRKSIVHRDLKPGNLLVTRAGVKVLDFGIAKMGREAGDSRLTGFGDVLGTPSYMPPEQVEGKSTDARSDIFAFGLVVYEMLTGRRPLDEGGSSQEPLLARGFAPPAVERVVRRCVAADPNERWQSAGDLRAALAWAAAERAPELPWWEREWKKLASAAVASLVFLVMVSRWIPAGATGTHAAPMMPMAKGLPARMQVPPRPEMSMMRVSVSPDGKSVAYVSGNRVYIRPVDGGASIEVPDSQPAGAPFWAPNGRAIAFTGGGKLKRFELGGVAPAVVCDVNTNMAGVWGEDGTILIGMIGGGIYRIPASGGMPERVTEVDQEREETRHMSPQFLPGGGFLYVAGTAQGSRSMLYGGRIGSRSRIAIMPIASTVEFVPSKTNPARGYLLFLQSGMLNAQALDIAKLRPVGAPAIIGGPTASGPAAGAAVQVGDFSATSDVLVYRSNRDVTVVHDWIRRLD